MKMTGVLGLICAYYHVRKDFNYVKLKITKILTPLADGLRAHVERHHVRHDARHVRHPRVEPDGDWHQYSPSSQGPYAAR